MSKRNVNRLQRRRPLPDLIVPPEFERLGHVQPSDRSAAVKRLDAAVFRDNPAHDRYRRDYVPGEAEENLPLHTWVYVRQVSPGLRLRYFEVQPHPHPACVMLDLDGVATPEQSRWIARWVAYMKDLQQRGLPLQRYYALDK